MAPFKPNPEQKKVVDNRSGIQVVTAGAGSGKTATMVEQLGRCVTVDNRGLDSLVSITFTDKAAGELKDRIRKWLIEHGKLEEAYNVESSSISTIHGFCSSLVRKNSLYLGIDPGFTVLDEIKANMLKRDAVIKAAEEFLSTGNLLEKLRFANLYGLQGNGNLARSVVEVCDELRGRGFMDPGLPVVEVRPVSSDDLPTLYEALSKAIMLAPGCSASEARDKEVALFTHILSLLKTSDKFLAFHTGEIEKLHKVQMRAGTPDYKAVKNDIKSISKSLITKMDNAKALPDYLLAREFFDLYAAHYRNAKERGGYLDFDDLQLLACELLKKNEGIRNALRDNIWLFQVDEFQDTNPLQAKIIELINPKNLCVVGDRNQSIYSFRHADVSLFDKFSVQCRENGLVNTLSTNYRSDKKILRFLNHIFSSDSFFQDKYINLQADESDKQKKDNVNSIIEISTIETRLQGGKVKAAKLRETEAELVARKMLSLHKEGSAAFGDMALLLRKFTNLDAYEKALQRYDIPYHVRSRQYFARSEVKDINSFVKILANPLDDLNFAAVMKSPFARLSDESLFILASIKKTDENVISLLDAARKINESALKSEEYEKLRRFIACFDDLHNKSRQVMVSELIELIVSSTGYDLAVLSMPYQNEAVFANIRKLVRQASAYQQLYGSDIRGFSDYIDEAKVSAGKEGSAQIEAEEGDVVKIMTVHSAKGLEFGYVFAPDLSGNFEPKKSYIMGAPVITYRPDKTLEHGGVGFKFSPFFGETIKAFDYEINGELKKAVETEEQKRVLYVALSRAEKGLFLSGGTGTGEKRSIVETVLDHLSFDKEELLDKGSAVATAGEAEVSLLYLKPEDIEPGEQRGSGVRSNHKEDYFKDGLVPEVYSGKPPVVSRLSASSLEDFIDCPAKFHFKNVLKLKNNPLSAGLKAEKRRSFTAADYGNIAHLLLYRTNWKHYNQPDERELLDCVRRFVDSSSDETEIAGRLLRDINRLADSGLGQELCSAEKVEKEVPFSFCVSDVVLHGFIDALVDRRTIIDYKTGTPDDKNADAYSLQTDLYCLGLLKSGAPEAISKIIFLEKPDKPVLSAYASSDMAALEEKFVRLIKKINESQFAPSKPADKYICGNCPGHGTTCNM